MIIRNLRQVSIFTRALLLVCTTVFFPPVAAADDVKTGSLRERIKERVINAKQDRVASESANVTATPITTGLSDLPGTHSAVIIHDGLVRRYLVHIPKTYRADTAVPLLFAFHGGGGDMNYMATDEYYGLISKSEAEGFIVIFPSGFSQLRSGKLATWNAGTCCADARDQNIDDVGFIREIINAVTTRLHIDRDRIFATGMSNGGMMSYRLACEMAGTFKAIAAVAGTDNTVSCMPSEPVSIMHIHASNDDRVLYNGGAGNKFRDESKVANFTSVPATIEKWVKQNSCNPVPQRVLETSGVYCDRYSACSNEAQVQLCVTASGGHSWPGGTKPRGESPSQAISANDVMWMFFTAIP